MFNKVIRPERVIQFGEGGFLRGFVDWILQITNEKTDFDGSVVVVQPIEKGLCERLEGQNCVYTHIMRGLKDSKPFVDKKIIDVISRTVEPYKNWESYISLATNPDFRFVVSNTTESGICFDHNDRPENAPYITFPAKVTMLLKKRFDLGLGGFVFLPCELIDKNGETLKKYILDYADLWGYGEDFKDFIESQNTFCNTLVDRIVTGYPKDEKIELGYTDNMLNTSELFHLWVIEGDNAFLKELPLDKTGLNIIITDNLEPYRTRKVRILNGAHTSMIPYAMLKNIETVGECMQDPEMSEFVKNCVYKEIVPTLNLPSEELTDYANSVFERFCNPFIRHLCSSISLNSISKFRVRVLPSLLEYIHRDGKKPHYLLTAFAKLIMFYKTDMPNDDLKVCEFMKNATIKEILANTELWNEDLSFLTDDITERMN